MSSFLEKVAHRRSYSRVDDEAPTHEDLLPLVAAAARVADHSALRPWRIIEVRGLARNRLGTALAEVASNEGNSHKAAKIVAKPLRAPLLLAIVAIHVRSGKVPEWEQDAVAAGVAHTLSLLLDDQGWGVMWRTGDSVRSPAVHRMHELAENEKLLGWLYVGKVPDDIHEGSRGGINATEFLSVARQ